MPVPLADRCGWPVICPGWRCGLLPDRRSSFNLRPGPARLRPFIVTEYLGSPLSLSADPERLGHYARFRRCVPCAPYTQSCGRVLAHCGMTATLFLLGISRFLLSAVDGQGRQDRLVCAHCVCLLSLRFCLFYSAPLSTREQAMAWLSRSTRGARPYHRAYFMRASLSRQSSTMAPGLPSVYPVLFAVCVMVSWFPFSQTERPNGEFVAAISRDVRNPTVAVVNSHFAAGHPLTRMLGGRFASAYPGDRLAHRPLPFHQSARSRRSCRGGTLRSHRGGLRRVQIPRIQQYSSGLDRRQRKGRHSLAPVADGQFRLCAVDERISLPGRGRQIGL